MKRSDYYCFQLAVVVVIVVACHTVCCHINYLHSECEKSVANYVKNRGKCVYTVRGGRGEGKEINLPLFADCKLAFHRYKSC